MNYSLLKSRTFWTIAIGVAIYIATNLGNPTADVVAVVLGIIASYFHLQTGNSATGTN